MPCPAGSAQPSCCIGRRRSPRLTVAKRCRAEGHWNARNARTQSQRGSHHAMQAKQSVALRRAKAAPILLWRANVLLSLQWPALPSRLPRNQRVRWVSALGPAALLLGPSCRPKRVPCQRARGQHNPPPVRQATASAGDRQRGYAQPRMSWVIRPAPFGAQSRARAATCPSELARKPAAGVQPRAAVWCFGLRRIPSKWACAEHAMLRSAPLMRPLRCGVWAGSGPQRGCLATASAPLARGAEPAPKGGGLALALALFCIRQVRVADLWRTTVASPARIWVQGRPEHPLCSQRSAPLMRPQRGLQAGSVPVALIQNSVPPMLVRRPREGKPTAPAQLRWAASAIGPPCAGIFNCCFSTGTLALQYAICGPPTRAPLVLFSAQTLGCDRGWNGRIRFCPNPSNPSVAARPSPVYDLRLACAVPPTAFTLGGVRCAAVRRGGSRRERCRLPCADAAKVYQIGMACAEHAKVARQSWPACRAYQAHTRGSAVPCPGWE